MSSFLKKETNARSTRTSPVASCIFRTVTTAPCSCVPVETYLSEKERERERARESKRKKERMRETSELVIVLRTRSINRFTNAISNDEKSVIWLGALLENSDSRSRSYLTHIKLEMIGTAVPGTSVAALDKRMRSGE